MQARCFLALLALVFLAASAVPSRAQTPSEEERAQALIAAAIDAARTRAAPNAQSLKPDAALTRIARERAAQLAAGAPFAHQDVLGDTPAIDMVQARFGRYGYIGENLFMQARGGRAFDAAAFAALAVKRWMASAGHRDNIVDSDYDTSGIGVVVPGNETYAVEVFRGSAPAGKPVPSAKTPVARLRGGWQLDGF